MAGFKPASQQPVPTTERAACEKIEKDPMRDGSEIVCAEGSLAPAAFTHYLKQKQLLARIFTQGEGEVNEPKGTCRFSYSSVWRCETTFFSTASSEPGSTSNLVSMTALAPGA
jgi:hypothetical protein